VFPDCNLAKAVLLSTAAWLC